MRPSKFVCFAVLLMVALALGEVDLGKLSHETSQVQDELDAILSQTAVDPLSRVSERPLAPRPTSEAERRQLRPILVEHSAGAKSSLPRFPSLLETGVGAVPAIFPVEGGYIAPDLTLPEPPAAAFERARAAFNATRVSDTELRLRKVFPKAVAVQADGVQDADVLVRPEAVIPRDPTTDAMLATFNVKYGVIDAENDAIPLSPLSAADLEDVESREGLSEVALDYKTVFDEANHAEPGNAAATALAFGQDVFDAEKDTVADVDKRLGQLWSKRWEYLAAEKAKAAKTVQGDPAVKDTYAVDPLFVQTVRSNDPASTLGAIYTRNELGLDAPVTESIADRVNFEPETSFYGPNVVALSVDKDSLPKPSEEFFTPKFDAPFASQPAKMTIIPSAKLARNRFRKLGFAAPEWRAGDEFDFNSASPAKLK